jgi:hypothetical protein
MEFGKMYSTMKRIFEQRESEPLGASPGFQFSLEPQGASPVF